MVKGLLFKVYVIFDFDGNFNIELKGLKKKKFFRFDFFLFLFKRSYKYFRLEFISGYVLGFDMFIILLFVMFSFFVLMFLLIL